MLPCFALLYPRAAWQDDDTLVATGEIGVRPKIMVWDATTTECTHMTRYGERRCDGEARPP
jgi:hypothetical protein